MAPAEEAEPKAEQAPKGKAPPRAKPKPQPQTPHPPSPAPPPLVARERGAAAVPKEEELEVEEARGVLKRGEANLREAKAKVAEKEEAIEGFDRAVRRSKRELAAVVARVKD